MIARGWITVGFILFVGCGGINSHGGCMAAFTIYSYAGIIGGGLIINVRFGRFVLGFVIMVGHGAMYIYGGILPGYTRIMVGSGWEIVRLWTDSDGIYDHGGIMV